MKPVLLVYATREGHTRRIAEHLASAFQARRYPVEVHDARIDEPIDLGHYSAAVLAASIHQEKHEQEMVRFARAHRAELEQIPSAFLSVSLSEAGVEDPAATSAYREGSRHDVEQMLHRFYEETGWRPSKVHAVAGALLYTHYGRLLRFVMKRIARAAGESTDTSRDHVFTDWGALDQVVDEIAAELGPPASVDGVPVEQVPTHP